MVSLCVDAKLVQCSADRVLVVLDIGGLLPLAQSSVYHLGARTKVTRSLENPMQHSHSNVDEFTGARAVRELLGLKAKMTELAPLLRGDPSDGRPLGVGCEMMVRGRGVVPEEAWQFLPVVDEAVNSIMELERRRWGRRVERCGSVLRG